MTFSVTLSKSEIVLIIVLVVIKVGELERDDITPPHAYTYCPQLNKKCTLLFYIYLCLYVYIYVYIYIHIYIY